DELVGGEIPGRGGRAFLRAVVLLRRQFPLDLREVQRQRFDRFAAGAARHADIAQYYVVERVGDERHDLAVALSGIAADDHRRSRQRLAAAAVFVQRRRRDVDELRQGELADMRLARGAFRIA